MHLVGITGPIKHGKSALVEALLRTEPDSSSAESSQVISEVADQINVALGKLAVVPRQSDFDVVKSEIDRALSKGLTAATPLYADRGLLTLDDKDVAAHPIMYDKLWQYLDDVSGNPAMLRTAITPDNKEAYRPILQWVGGYVTTKLQRSIWYEELVRRGQVAAEAGCRLFVLGGVRFPADAEVIRRSGGLIIAIERPGLPELDSLDPTEAPRRKIKIDTTVINNGTLAQLDSLSGRLLADIYASDPQDIYEAKAF